jgi:hypothetical protein
VETLAFYSYKGGVGRSLLLANTARYLATLGRRVVALDLDFEAPGLHYKLPSVIGRPGRHRRQNIPMKGGAVPYLLATAEGSASPPPLETHVVQVPVPTGSKGWLRLMPAGPAPQRPYWTALKDLGERLRLDDASGQGLMALLDLQARIEEELKPHYLLIDARTGVTELGGLATTVLADAVICLFVANQESIDGTLIVAEALKNAPRLKEQQPIRIVPVLSRTTGPPSDQRLIGGIRRLLELGEGRQDPAKSTPEVFVLPHDEATAANERVVGGAREASAFSPLYKAYLELYQHLFPGNADGARDALERLEAVAGVKEQLTEGRRGGRYGFGPYLEPWSPGAIEEGVEVENQRYGEPKRRYADLVCRDATGRVVMIVEYLRGSANEARKFWQEKTDVRCVVLVSRGEHGTQRKLLSRAPHEQELRESERWDVPLPKEFEVFRDIGDRSIEAMLEALRRGHQETAAWLVEEWQLSVAALSEVRSPAWRPDRAKRILDGLAATEDDACGEAVLRQATLGDPHPMRRERRMFREGWASGDEYDRWMESELLAPLFWRLPVEAILRYQEPRRYPGEVPSQAGYRLLAQDLMGLQYEPVRIALMEAETYGRRFSASVSSTEESDVALRWVHRGWWRITKQLQIADDLPPVLVWDELLREKPYWRGSLDEAIREFGPEKLKALGSPNGLRSRLRGLVDRRELVTEGLLGDRDGDRRITLNRPAVVAVADLMGLSPRYVKSVVFIHLAALALAYDARDLDGGPGYGFARNLSASPPAPPSPVHVGLAQAFTHRLILRLGDSNLLMAFEKLAEHQAEPYRQWKALRRVPLEELRILLLRARGNPTMVGMPRPETDGD